MGYRALIDMSKKTRLKEIPSSDIKYTGHYVDHELVENIEIDCEARLKRIRNGENRRVLISIGGAGAQQELVENIIRYMLEDIKNEKVALFINVGDHKNVWENIAKNIKGIEVLAKKYFNKYDELQELSDKLKTEEAKGLYVIYNENIFEAVYATNILMRDADIFITKPSELSFYPVPKLLIERVGGHEAWGAIRSSEVGDGTIECRNLDQTLQFLELMLKENDLLELMCDAIVKNKKIGIYNGAYEVVKLAVGEK
jgi:hypothetical protein